MTNTRKSLIWLSAAFLLLTLQFIWSNSARDAVASTAQSDAVGIWMERLFDVTREPFRFFYDNRRKLAHFAEFFLLGTEMELWLRANGKCTLFSRLAGVGFSLAAAAMDETIQLFSRGRVASLLDVALDFCGAFVGLWLCFGVFHLFSKKSQFAHQTTD